MKQDIKDYCKNFDWKCDLEVIFNDGSELRINDAQVTAQNMGAFAVECQCSNIPFQEVEERNKFYVRNRKYPVWILGGKFFDKTYQSCLTENRAKKHRIGKLERSLLKRFGKLFYYGNERYYEASFDYEEGKKTLGWFKLEETTLYYVLIHYISLFDLYAANIYTEPFYVLHRDARHVLALKEIAEKLKDSWFMLTPEDLCPYNVRYRFRNIGDKIEGFLLLTCVNEYQMSCYCIKTEKEILRIDSTTQLESLMKKVKLNDYVKIKFLGKTWTRNKRQMHLFEVIKGSFDDSQLCVYCPYCTPHDASHSKGYCTRDVNLVDEFPDIVDLYDACKKDLS